MALIKCKECGKEISDKAKQCINCGAPIEEEKKEVNKESSVEQKSTVNEQQNNVQNNDNSSAVVGIIFIAIVVVIVLFSTGVFGSDSEDEEEVKEESILEASKLSNSFSTDSRKDSIYGGTVHDELQFSEDGTVFWGQCYSKTGKCTGFTYTYTKSDLDVTIYNDDNSVQYSCYFNSNSDYTLYCKHRNGYSYSNYKRIN